MQKLLLVVMLFFAVGIAQMSAQDATPKPKKENFSWTKKYMDEAGFDADLQAKIETAKKASDVEIKAVKDNADLSEEDKKKQLSTLMAKRQKTIANMLTDEQKAKVDEIKAAIKKRNEAVKE